VTQLSSLACARDTDELDRMLERHTGDHETPELAAERLTAGTVDDHIGRFRGLADAGVEEVIVSLHDVGEPGAIERFAPVIQHMR
jgi:hypothetical protein